MQILLCHVSYSQKLCVDPSFSILFLFLAVLPTYVIDTDGADSNASAGTSGTISTGTGTLDQFQNLGAGTKNVGVTSPLTQTTDQIHG